jgi:cytochrome c5
MTVQFSPSDLAVQMRIKTVFDPHWQLNAAKVFPARGEPGRWQPAAARGLRSIGQGEIEGARAIAARGRVGASVGHR